MTTWLIQPAVRDTSGRRASGSSGSASFCSESVYGSKPGSSRTRVDGATFRSSSRSSRRTSTFVPSASTSTTRSPRPAIGFRSGAPPWTPHHRASSPLELPGERGELALDDGADGVLGGLGHRAPEPGAGIDERHVAAVVGPEAQQPAARGRLEERAPARGHAVGERLVAEVPRQGRRQRGPGHRRVREDVADRVLQREHLVGGDLEVAEPDRPQPVDARAEGADELRQLVRRDEVQRPAHRPRLDQRPVAPQRVADVVPSQAVDAGVDRELRGAHDLCLDGDEATDDVEHLPIRGALLQVVTLHPERGDLLPGRLDHRPSVPTRSSRRVTFADSPVWRVWTKMVGSHTTTLTRRGGAS